MPIFSFEGSTGSLLSFLLADGIFRGFFISPFRPVKGGDCILETAYVSLTSMRLKFQKTIALLLLSAFLATSTAGNVLGCTELVGGERAQVVSTTAEKKYGADELISNHDDSHDVSAIYRLGDEQHSSCPDCSTQLASVVFSKRTKRIPTTTTIATLSNSIPLTAATSVKLAVGNLAPQPPTKTSQTLLAHRTVVLLY